MSKIDNIICAIEEMKIELLHKPQYKVFDEGRIYVMGEQLRKMHDAAMIFKDIEEGVR